MFKILLGAALVLFNLTSAALAAPDAAATYQAGNVVELLTTYGKMTGKKILLDTTVQGQVAIIASPDENVDRKVELIEKTLFLNGFTLIDAGDDVVAVLGLGKPARSAALPLYTKPEELPGGQRVCSYLFKLAHRNPLEVVGILNQYMPPSSTTAFTPDKGSRTILATGQTSVIKTLIKLVAELDVPVAEPAEKAGEPKVGPTPAAKSAGGTE